MALTKRLVHNEWVRFGFYVILAASVVRVAVLAGVAHEKRTYCGPSGLDDNDCGIVTVVAGYEWAAVALVMSAVLIGLLEWLIRRFEPVA